MVLDEVGEHNDWAIPGEGLMGLSIAVAGCQWGKVSVCDAWGGIPGSPVLGEIFRCPRVHCHLNVQARAELYPQKRFVSLEDGSEGGTESVEKNQS